MKLKIVQAVKLGTVACLLAVTTQTIASDVKGLGSKFIVCSEKSDKHFKLIESGNDKDGNMVQKTTSGNCNWEYDSRISNKAEAN